MTNIYEKHDKAFNNIAAYVIINPFTANNERCATLSFKRSQAGNVTCFFHQIGQQMQSGKANGYGYDKHAASFYNAAEKNYAYLSHNTSASDRNKLEARLLLDAAKEAQSRDLRRSLEDKGFILLQAI